MNRHRVTLSKAVDLEDLGPELLVRSPDGVVTRLTGDAADLVRRASVSPVEDASLVSIELAKRGILHSHGKLSRRGVLAGGVAGLGLGLTSLVFPTAAFASSQVHPLKGLILDYGGLVLFWLTDEYVPEGDEPSEWWPNPKPSSNLSDVSDLTVGEDLFILDTERSDLFPGDNDSLYWISDIPWADAELRYTGTFTWLGHRFSVTFERLPEG